MKYNHILERIFDEKNNENGPISVRSFTSVKKVKLFLKQMHFPREIDFTLSEETTHSTVCHYPSQQLFWFKTVQTH